jgi:transcriptional regulator with XRE-family HTH domain
VFSQEVPRLLKERGMSIRALARESGVSDAHLSRLIRGVGYRSTPSGDLAARVARALDLPIDYFREYRERIVVDAVKRDKKLREELYDRVTRGRPGSR